MPIFIPFIIGAVVTAAGGVGAKKGYDGVQGVRGASAMVKAATARHRVRVGVLDSARGHISKELQMLQELRQQTALSTLGRIVTLLQELERSGRVRGVDSFKRVGVKPEEVRAFTGQYVNAGGLLKGGVVAAGMGAGASSAAASFVTTFATASTGTAISGLSGAAANSALLAWLGGGSLATGGLGMAGGAVVAGGIAVAPAVLVGGLILAAQAEKALEQATKFSSEVDVAIAKIDMLVALLRRAERRVGELASLTRGVDARAHLAMDALEAIVPTFDDERDEDVEKLRAAVLLCTALGQIIDVRVLDDDGQLDSATDVLLDQYSHLMESAQA
jgi:hypothetical protein